MLFRKAKGSYLTMSVFVVVCLTAVAGVSAEQIFYEDFSNGELSEDWLELKTHPATPNAEWPLEFVEIDGRTALAINIQEGIDIRGEIWSNAVESNTNVVVVELKYMVQHELQFDFIPKGAVNLLVMPSSEKWIPAGHVLSSGVN